VLAIASAVLADTAIGAVVGAVVRHGGHGSLAGSTIKARVALTHTSGAVADAVLGALDALGHGALLQLASLSLPARETSTLALDAPAIARARQRIRVSVRTIDGGVAGEGHRLEPQV